MPLAPGSTLGRYRIESRIGAGAMGVVYLARDARLKRRVALKLITPALAADPDFRTRFEREARAAAALDHPHLLPVYEAGEEDGQLYLAMRYVPGVDLATHLARHGPLDMPSTLRLVTQLAAALDAAHAAGLVHRDVKPANVLLGPNDHAYLADFGLARSATGSGITRPGQLVGTADYTAPELLRGASASPASDTYALACLAVECLTGESPFGRGDEMATLYAHAHDPVPPLVEQRPELPPGLQAVVERGLAKDPADRYPSAGELAMALEGAAATDDAFQPTSSPPSRRIIAFGGIGALLLIGAVAMGAVIFGAAMLRESLGGADPNLPGASAPALSVTGSAMPTTSAAPTAEEFPSAAEERLLTLLDPQARNQCDRAAPDDAPVYFAEEPGSRTVLRTDAGIDCALGGITSPDRVWVWELSDSQLGGDYNDPRIGVDADGQLTYRATRVDAPAAACGGQVPALETWSFEGQSGRLLCYETETGDAVIEWTHDGTQLLGKALRDDRDMPAVLRWWDEHLRSVTAALTPSPSAETAEQELDPECEAAFVAGLEAREAEPVTYLDPALFACETLADFRAVVKAYPDALDFPHVQAFMSTRCRGNEVNRATPICMEAEGVQ